jgi:uncharacterized delta-60 repeat protein
MFRYFYRTNCLRNTMKHILVAFFIIVSGLSFSQSYSIDTDFGMLPGITHNEADYMRMVDKMILTPEGGSIMFYSNYDDWDWMQLYMCKLKSDGTYDSTFNGNGIVQIYGIVLSTWTFIAYEDIIVDKYSNVYLCGTYKEEAGMAPYQSFLLKYTSSGIIDSTFGEDGFVFSNLITTAYRLQILEDESFIMAGSTSDSGDSIGVIHVLPDGSIDDIFGDAGIQVINASAHEEYPMALEIDAFGRIVIGVKYTDLFVETDPGGFEVIRLLENGTLDTTFNEDGIFIYETGLGTLLDLQVFDNGDILLGGRTSGDYLSWDYDFVILKLTEDGNLDGSFSTDGIGTYGNPDAGEWVTKMCIQEDGNILVGGTQMFNDIILNGEWMIFQIDASGVRNDLFNESGSITLNPEDYYDFCWSYECYEQDYLVDFYEMPDNKLLLCGSILNGFNYSENGGVQGVVQLKDSACIIPSGELDVAICPDDSLYFNDAWLYEGGLYYEHSVNMEGCDSITILHLSVSNLFANAYPNSTGIYWSLSPALDSVHLIDCATLEVVQVAYSVLFELNLEIEQSGTYALVAYYDGCVDTSACTEFVLDSIPDQVQTMPSTAFNVYPNPSNGYFVLESNLPADELTTFRLVSATGMEQKMQVIKNADNQFSIDMSMLPAGLYMLSVFNEQQINATVKIIKQE